MSDPATTTPPLYLEIWFRRCPADRWRKTGRATTRAEALVLIGDGSAGDWWLRPIFANATAGPNLLTEVAAEDDPAPAEFDL